MLQHVAACSCRQDIERMIVQKKKETLLKKYAPNESQN
jgi:hypothetical protein